MKLAARLGWFTCVCSLAFVPPLFEIAHAAALPASIAHLRLHEGESFLKIRARLIESGWAPIDVHAGENYEYDGTEKRLALRQFNEVDFCSTDRGSLCVLHYKKGGTCLRIDTVGEQVELMRVTKWEASCPAGESKRSEIGGRPPALENQR